MENADFETLVTKKKVAAKAKKSLSVDEIYARILTAISEHRLQPGTQLVEDRLAKIFDVSRTKIREATVRLVHDRIATNIPNRGAFVSSPTADDAREIFAARRLIEPELMRMAARNATPRQVALLRAHVEKENAARRKDGYTIIPISGDFHLLVAEMAGNSFLARTLRELESITCLVIILYDTHGAQGCPYDDHQFLVDAIEARDEARAGKLMLEHLDHIEHSLNLSPPADKRIPLEDAFL
ncbi:GntR family transcriptional regulator [Variovorax robiniae]|uniref:GntR family transcriptional regulator n=1 Tax=Variovorax robiniae TaxID=1836199 RepID=A0ABU8XFH8_9BURK